ncbi:NAD(P)/FAD-dependent oxidoreductase [Paracoccus aminovorans]|uniref:NAD(P)/FAD-dependent oxidoreductase n=1 Tax=Paracoccus aminovorans TaxID=34004 RepID=UPI00078630BF|nr:FAD/NAD(P)-binding oxidoreductase [Paracoccus aminovorans]
MTRVLVVGAGPAGIRAAERLVRAGLRPVVVDEAARAGGQIYRRPPEGFTRPPEKLYGSEAGKARALHALFDGMVAAGQVDYRPHSAVHAIRDGVAHVGAARIPHDRLILATGATDRLVPVDGWQRAGVYSLGAAQIALKAQGVAIGRQIVLAGSGPLLTLVAAQLLAAGAGVAAVLDTSSLATQMRGGIGMALTRPAVTARGLAMRARLGRLYHAGVRLERIAADAVHWCDGWGRAQVTECDAVALGWHLRAETQLADLAGARFAWSDTWAQWLPVADEMGRAGPGLYLAGDGLRILGADGAEVAGALAANACLTDLGIATPGTRALLRRARRLHCFAAAMAHAFPWPSGQLDALPDAAVLCRCEGITLGQMRDAAGLGGAEANRVKSLGRIGMGRCQGRYCQLAAAALIARHAGLAPQEAGRLRGQPPVRPVPVGALLED